MKIYALLIMTVVALAGCSTSYKGSIQGSSNTDALKGSSYVCQAGTGQSGLVVDK
jgi:hypothetical protein